MKIPRPILPNANHAEGAHDSWHDIIYWTLLTVACIVMLVMNVLTPYKEDDMGFSLIDGVWKPVQTLGDFLLSCRNHFAGTNGRLADLVPALFAAFLGKGAFNVCNALVFGLFAHVVTLLSAQRHSITVLAMLIAVVGTCYPIPGETMLWMAGSANYLWAITASLLLVYVLQHRQGTPLGIDRGLLLLLGAIVAGGFNEATSIGFFAGLCLYYIFNRGKFDRWAAVALAGYLMGLLIIVSSPAAWSRAVADGGVVSNLPFGDMLKARFNIFHEKVWQFYLPAAALAVGIISLAFKRGKAVRQSLWTYVFLCLSLVMFVLGLRYERAYSPWATVSFIILAMGVDWLLSRWPSWLRIAVIGLSLALSVFTYGRGIIALRDYQQYDSQMMSEITASPTQAILLERQFDRYNRFIKPMNYESTNFFGHENVYRAYYGKENVQFVSDSIHMRYLEGRLLDGAQPLPTTSDRPDVIGAAYTIPGQNYMAVELLTDTLPAMYQVARYLPSCDNDKTLTPEEQQRRDHYGINLDYTPAGFYPIEYQGKRYFICSTPDPSVSRIVFPLDDSATPDEAILAISQ